MSSRESLPSKMSSRSFCIYFCMLLFSLGFELRMINPPADDEFGGDIQPPPPRCAPKPVAARPKRRPQLEYLPDEQHSSEDLWRCVVCRQHLIEPHLLLCGLCCASDFFPPLLFSLYIHLVSFLVFCLFWKNSLAVHFFHILFFLSFFF